MSRDLVGTGQKDGRIIYAPPGHLLKSSPNVSFLPSPQSSSFTPRASQCAIVDGFPVDAMIRRLCRENPDDISHLQWNYRFLTREHLVAMMERLNLKNATHLMFPALLREIIMKGRREGYDRFSFSNDLQLLEVYGLK